jgi:DNA invertase Pin-like site-specific DNA recombinase
MRAALYARFSTDLQREESISDQYRSCERVAHVHGLQISHRFSDEGISGGTAARPGYQAMLDAARLGQFDLIIAEDISRLWRNRAEFGSRSAELEDCAINLVTCVGDDTRRDGWMVVTIKLAIAEQARREISYRTRRGMEGLALARKSTGGRCYGYRDGAIYGQEATVVRAIFVRRAAGASLGLIARTLPADRAPNGMAWSRSTLQGILANRRYTGAVIWGARETIGGARDSKLKTRRMRSEGPIVKRHDPALAIISQELFESVQKNRLQTET